METVSCPKCGETIATSETTCPACKVVIADFLKTVDDVEAAMKHIAKKNPAPVTNPTSPAIPTRKRSMLNGLTNILKGKR